LPWCCFHAFCLVPVHAYFIVSLFLTRELARLSQVREKIQAVHARRAELASAIKILSRAASSIRAGRGCVASAPIGGGGGDVTLASVTRSLVQARWLRGQFDRRWGFARDRTLGAALRVCVCVCVCVCVGI